MNLTLSTSNSILVMDTGPLLALARINRCYLLTELFKECHVTASVAGECLAKPEHADALHIQHVLSSGLLIIIPDPKIRQSLRTLDAGEQTAIEYALRSNFVLLIDDKRGRSVAKAKSVSVIGTIGILLLAKKRGLIPKVKSLLATLEQQYYFSKTLIQDALDIADE